MGVDNMGKIGFIREENKSNDKSKKDGLRLKKLEVEFIGREKEIAPKNIEVLEEEINNTEVKKPKKKNRINRKIVSILVKNGIEEKYAKEISRNKEESDRFLKLINDKKENELENGSKIIKSRFTLREEEEDRLFFLDNRMDSLNSKLMDAISKLEQPMTNEILIDNILDNKPIIVDKVFEKEMKKVKSMLHEYKEIVQEIIDIQNKIDKNKRLINVDEQKNLLKMYELAVKKFE